VKKILLSLMVLAILIMSLNSFGASGTTVTADSVYHNSRTGSSFRVVTIIFKADGSGGTIPDTTLNGNTTGITQGLFLGWQLSEVYIDGTSGVTPTENSDLYVYQNSDDLLDGNGVDMIDNTAVNSVYSGVSGSGPYSRPVNGDLTITATQAATAVNSAVGTFKLTFR